MFCSVAHLALAFDVLGFGWLFCVFVFFGVSQMLPNCHFACNFRGFFSHLSQNPFLQNLIFLIILLSPLSLFHLLFSPSCFQSLFKQFFFPVYLLMHTRELPIKVHRGREQNVPILIPCRYLDELGPRQLGLPVADSRAFSEQLSEFRK